MIRLAVRVQKADAELVLAELLVLAPGGVEEIDHDEFIEYAIYGARGEVPELPDVQAAVGSALVDVTTSEVVSDWHERWKQFHKPITISEQVHVRPPWHDRSDGNLVDIVVDPGQAFGTGAHPTTRLCLELLLKLDPGGALVDLGCGSGVLAIASQKLGWDPVIALDNDPAALEATARNAELNDSSFEIRRFDLRTEPLSTAPTIIANLLRPLLLELEQKLTAPPHQLIASGLLVHEADEISAAFAKRGLTERARLEEGDWAALLLTL